MNWMENVYNRKGFIHHPDTPQEDKDFYIYHKEKARQLLQIGEKFINEEGILSHRSMPRGKEELGTKSKHLHRGIYCPSPVLDILITNAKRGRILVRPSERSKISNRYVYDEFGKLIFIDNYIDDKMISSEYLLYQDNTIYGVEVGMSGRIICVSEEQYAQGKLICYIRAYNYGAGNTTECGQLDCEKYHYDDVGLLDWDYYQLDYGCECIAPSGFIDHKRFRFIRKDGMLKGFYLVNNDGSTIEGSFVNEIKMNRKAK